ncbi:hypothetical protein SLEP1_g26619 [Rubroshorea leprosula]|uniref:Uncharacterized protein n=1 Tax=Rubroshorea leprosula TaxID=152421 RepID=A0AAV5JQH6_9ROSI|nr:hypothetical protein SLEP1_g26619 [Rubroshorea leprosula]
MVLDGDLAKVDKKAWRRKLFGMELGEGAQQTRSYSTNCNLDGGISDLRVWGFDMEGTMMIIDEYNKDAVLHMGKHYSVMSQQQTTRELEPVEDEPRMSSQSPNSKSLFLEGLVAGQWWMRIQRGDMEDPRNRTPRGLGGAEEGGKKECRELGLRTR